MARTLGPRHHLQIIVHGCDIIFVEEEFIFLSLEFFVTLRKFRWQLTELTPAMKLS